MKVALPSLGKKPQKAPSWREMLELRPVRNPGLEWTEGEDDRVVIHVKHNFAKNWKVKAINFLIPLPSERSVALDAIGTDVWRLMDGENTVGRIARELAKKYKLQPREAELSLQQYFKELGRRGYVGFLQAEPVKPGEKAKQRRKK